MKTEKYKVLSSTFKGQTEGRYTYEIVFNQSLQHTGRFKGIEDGLNEYAKKENRQNFIESLQDVWHTFKKLFQ